MSRVTSTEVVVPKKLSPSERSALIDGLYAVHSEIFDGVEKQAFVKYVVDSKAELTWILLYRGEDNAIVGYLALHVFERRLRGEMTAVFRAEAGTLRAYRGRNASVNFGLRKIIEYLVAHPGRPVFYLGSLVHPSSYSLFAKYGTSLYPSAGNETPPDILQFMGELADEFGIPVVDPAHPLVRDVGWITRETDVERRYWRHCDRPAARFFIAQNPGYVDGHGLVTLLPLRLPEMLRAAAHITRAKADLWVDELKIFTHRLPIGSQLLRPMEVRKLLGTVSLFAGLGRQSFDALVASAEVVGLRPGQFLLREGDPGEDLFVLARGAVYVLSGPRGEELVIDELDKGSVFGEIAVLSGSTRTASIRTATPCTVVRVPRRALLALMKDEPALREAIWKAFAARVFDDFIRASGRYEHLDREARAAWIGRASHRELEAGQAETFEGQAFAFALRGTVEVERDGAWSATQAPLMMEGRAPVRIHAKTATRIAIVPPLEQGP
ncbi:MAG: cyclic nucleotide-binding domain-containing protein [Polyangiaceae bacterium]